MIILFYLILYVFFGRISLNNIKGYFNVYEGERHCLTRKKT